MPWTFAQYRHFPVFLCGLLLGIPGRAAATPPCQDVGPWLAATTGCDYGAPVRSGTSLLVPKVCRIAMGGKNVDRHTVEVRNSTGAKLGQASLPPTPADTNWPQPGFVLAGTPPLLVVPAGIAGLELRTGTAEFVYEPQGTLIAVTRQGDLLALAERVQAPIQPGQNKAVLAKNQPNQGAVEWTVLDLDAGTIVGQQHLAGPELEGLGWQQTAQGQVEAVLVRTAQGKRLEIAAVVVDAAGKVIISKDGTLDAKVRPAGSAGTAVSSGPDQCVALTTGQGAVLGSPGVVLSQEPSRNRMAQGQKLLPWQGPLRCEAVMALDTASGQGAAVLITPTGRALHWVRCATDGTPAPVLTPAK